VLPIPIGVVTTHNLLKEINVVYFSCRGVRLSPLSTSVINWPTVPARMTDDEYEAVGGMRSGRGNRSTRRKPVPVPHCPQQIPHDLTWVRTRAAAVGSRRLT
jgi:hypothetical protein